MEATRTAARGARVVAENSRVGIAQAVDVGRAFVDSAARRRSGETLTLVVSELATDAPPRRRPPQPKP